MYIFIGSIQLANDSTRWGEGISILNILFSSSSLIYFVFYISASLVLTALSVLYLFFKPQNESKETNENYKSFVRNFSLKTSLIFSIILFVLVTLSVFTIPDVALSYSVFGTTLLALFILMVIANLFYFMLKESSTRFRSSASIKRISINLC